MTTSPHVCLIGQILVDVTLPRRGEPYKLRAGGIIHAARALWAIECPYSLCYCAPNYLDVDIAEHAHLYQATHAERIGVVSGSPNVILIGEPKEVGSQGYEYLLRDKLQCDLSEFSLESSLGQQAPTDVLLFPGGFDLVTVLKVVGRFDSRVHIDANFEPSSLEVFGTLGRQFDTIILSTSSSTFLDRFKGDSAELRDALVGTYAHRFLLKENRGGSRLFLEDGPSIQTPAQTRPIQHSIGVGDCFNAVYLALRQTRDDRAAMAIASCIAAEYASTTYPEVFRDNARTWLAVPDDEIVELSGVQLPWEARRDLHIYVAAPDFDHVDTSPIDTVADALRYHNFVPRLPVREHGQMEPSAPTERRQTLCDADLALLDECKLLVAVLLYDDPGTLIEIGIAIERGMPVLVYDPYKRADNLMLTQLPNLVSSDLDEVISGVFTFASKAADR